VRQHPQPLPSVPSSGRRQRYEDGLADRIDLLWGAVQSGRYRAQPSRRVATTLKAIQADLMQWRHEPIKTVGVWPKSVVQGYLNYHAVPENVKRLGMFRAEVCRA
jgi:hypothetical protein